MRTDTDCIEQTDEQTNWKTGRQRVRIVNSFCFISKNERLLFLFFLRKPYKIMISFKPPDRFSILILGLSVFF